MHTCPICSVIYGAPVSHPSHVSSVCLIRGASLIHAVPMPHSVCTFTVHTCASHPSCVLWIPKLSPHNYPIKQVGSARITRPMLMRKSRRLITLECYDWTEQLRGRGFTRSSLTNSPRVDPQADLNTVLHTSFFSSNFLTFLFKV